MTDRQLTGTVTLADGTTIANGSLTAVPFEPFPADESEGLLIPKKVTYTISAGAIDVGATIVAPAYYTFTVIDVDGQVIMTWRGPVPEGAGSISLQTIYQLAGGDVQITPAVTDQINDAIAAHEATYDSNADGKVNAADSADQVPWSGVTAKPATFPPDAHDHFSTHYTKAEIDALLDSLEVLTVGDVKAQGHSTIGPNWMPCDGRELDRIEYALLFAVIGTENGAGDGVNTFNIPDLRGRAPVSAGQGIGLTNRTVGEQGGLETVVLTEAQMASHTHQIQVNSAPGGQQSVVGMYLATEAVGATSVYQTSHDGNTMASDAITNSGSDQPHENMQPFSVVQFAIKVA